MLFSAVSVGQGSPFWRRQLQAEEFVNINSWGYLVCRQLATHLLSSMGPRHYSVLAVRLPPIFLPRLTHNDTFISPRLAKNKPQTLVRWHGTHFIVLWCTEEHELWSEWAQGLNPPFHHLTDTCPCTSAKALWASVFPYVKWKWIIIVSNSEGGYDD